jgi:hypothetical protein
LVLDPFVGGGTSGVEAMALGRRFVGSDLNQLAVFIARAKMTLLSTREADDTLRWAGRVDAQTTKRWNVSSSFAHVNDDHRVPWSVRRSIALALQSIDTLGSIRARRVARASVLRLGQWALDGRQEVPARREFVEKLEEFAVLMVGGSLALRDDSCQAFGLSRAGVEGQRRIRCVAAQRVGESSLIPDQWGAPKLVLTSPPYHGVHILYHRWQVQGRRETAVPYWIAGCRDGQPASYYTFGSRVRTGGDVLRGEYFRNVQSSFTALRKICDESTTIVQLVGFSDPQIQLQLYRESMRNAGFDEVDPEQTRVTPASAQREVPNRKWYLQALGRACPSGREFLLMHRVAR